MTILPILAEPDSRLRRKSQPVACVDDALRTLMDDMLKTMYAANGIGLAAIQVGIPKRVIVMDLGEGAGGVRYFVNPVLSQRAEKRVPYMEGCLSVPGASGEVERPETCCVSYLDYDGKEKKEVASGLFATCIQHEMDHLEGILFIDHLSWVKRDMIKRRLRKARQRA